MPDWMEPLKEQLLDYADNILKQKEIKQRIKDWLERKQQEYIEDVLPAEMDFQGLSEYLSVGIQIEAKQFLCGTLDEQKTARETILAKACEHAHAADSRSREQVERITDSVLKIMHSYAREQMDEKTKFILGEHSRNMETAILRAMRQLESPPQTSVKQEPLENGKRIGIYKKPRRTACYITSDCNKAVCEHIKYQNRLLIMGMPGIGKTEGVLWYLERVKYDSVIWLNFETLEQSMKSMGDFFVRISGALEKWEGDKESIVLSMLQLLAERIDEYKNAVVIFDNVNNKDLLKLLSDVEFPCHVIITSWLNYHYGYFLDAEVLRWQGLNMDKSMDLFLSMTGGVETGGDGENIRKLLQLCDGIPLVIKQAAAYIMESQISIEKYMDMCRTAATLKFNQTGGRDLCISSKNANVCVTFYLPYQALCREYGADEVFWHLLSSICCLSPDGIAEELLLEITGLPFERFNDSLTRILRYSLVERSCEKVFMKQIVQDILFSFVDDSEKIWAVMQIGRILAKEFLKLPLLTTELERYKELGLNGDRFLTVMERSGLTTESMPELLLGMGSYYYLQGFLPLAQRYLQKALRLLGKSVNQQLGLRILSVLGEVYEEAGDNDAAMKCIAGIRENRELMLKEEPLVVIQGLIAEAHIYENLGQYEQALSLIEQVLEMIQGMEDMHAKGYYMSANISKINIFNQLKRYDDAVQVFMAVGKEFHFSKEQIPRDVLAVELYGSMANSLLCQGKVQEALKCYFSQLAFYREFYKNEYHPSIAYASDNIAIAYIEMMEFEEAEQWLEQAEKVLLHSAPSHHEMLLQTYFRYGQVKYWMKDYKNAWEAFQKALNENNFNSDSRRKKRLEINAGIMMAYTQYGMHNWNKAMELLKDVYAKEVEAGIQESSAAVLMNNHEILIREVTAGKKIEDVMLVAFK